MIVLTVRIGRVRMTNRRAMADKIMWLRSVGVDGHSGGSFHDPETTSTIPGPTFGRAPRSDSHSILDQLPQIFVYAF
jgi:hypothetical protein